MNSGCILASRRWWKTLTAAVAVVFSFSSVLVDTMFSPASSLDDTRSSKLAPEALCAAVSNGSTNGASCRGSTLRAAWQRRAPPAPQPCSTDEIHVRSTRFRALVDAFGFYNSSCPSSSWIAALRNADVAALHDVYINAPRDTAIPPSISRITLNIGANKGYLAASLIGYWKPWTHVTPQSLRSLLEEVPIPRTLTWKVKCGICSDCRSILEPLPEHINSANDKPWNEWLSTHLSLTVFAIEPMPLNLLILDTFAAKLTAAGYGGTLLPLQYGIADFNGLGSFEMTDPGDEVASLDSKSRFRRGRPLVNVSIKTVDALVAAHVDPSVRWVIDIIHIDTEGYDPGVLDGAASTLPYTRVVAFEYNEVSMWANRSLESVVDTLDTVFGFNCYLEWGRFLMRLSGCWSTDFETHAWSNVLCVNRRDARWAAILAGIANEDTFM